MTTGQLEEFEYAAAAGVTTIVEPGESTRTSEVAITSPALGRDGGVCLPGI
jgi:hypothetical protein